MAEQLIASLAGEFDPTKYQDEYRERVLELIEAKAAGEEIVIQPQEEPAKVPDLMAALEAEPGRRAEDRQGGSSRTRKRAASGDGGEPAKKPARRGTRAKAAKKS